MTTNAQIARLFSEADFRKQVETVGPIDFVVDTAATNEIRAQAEKRGLHPLLNVIAVDPEANELPASLRAAGIKRPLWVFSPAHEERILRRLDRLDRPALGFYRDIYGIASAGRAEAPIAAAALNAYALVCTARSGSTYVCELLARNRGGKPKEHLRPPVIDMIASDPGNTRQATFIEAILRNGQKDGVFGTKLIAHFCKAARTVFDLAALGQTIDGFGAFRIVYLIRKDKVLQAISTERAQQTNIYHIRNEQIAQSSAKAAFVYDYDAIRARVDLLHREEEEVQSALAALPYPVLVVGYEALVENPEEQMRLILDFLQIDRSQIETDTRIMKISNEETNLIADRFCQEFKQRTGTAPRRFFVS